VSLTPSLRVFQLKITEHKKLNSKKIILAIKFKTCVEYKIKSQTHNKIIKVITACLDFISLKNSVCNFVQNRAKWGLPTLHMHCDKPSFKLAFGHFDMFSNISNYLNYVQVDNWFWNVMFFNNWKLLKHIQNI